MPSRSSPRSSGSPEADEPPSRWERKQRLIPRWGPASPAQGAEVLRLAREHRGALVRLRPDRTAEVLTATKRERFRYVVTRLERLR